MAVPSASSMTRSATASKIALPSPASATTSESATRIRSRVSSACARSLDSRSRRGLSYSSDALAAASPAALPGAEDGAGAESLALAPAQVLEQIASESGGKIKTAVNPGEGAFYGPKFEYVLRDAIGRDWQCGTTQVDFNLPERFGAFYIGADGEKKVPVMIHRAICGSMERYLGILIEHFAGHFPLWLAPTQVVVATITSDSDAYALEVRDMLRKSGLRAETDLRNEKINYKVREHSVQKVPVILVVGKREMEERAVNLRRLGSQDQTPMSLDDALAALKDEAVPPDLKRG